jgi:hypothetical protein
MAIPPIVFTARKLVRSYADRLSRLPPSHLVHTITTHNPALSAIGPTHPVTTLVRLRSFSQTQDFTLPPRTRDRRLTHDRITFPSFPLTPHSHATTRKCLTRKAAICPVLIVYSVKSTIDGFISAWVLQSDTPTHRGPRPPLYRRRVPGHKALLAGIHDYTFQSNTGNYSLLGRHSHPFPSSYQSCPRTWRSSSTGYICPCSFFCPSFPGTPPLTLPGTTLVLPQLAPRSSSATCCQSF